MPIAPKFSERFIAERMYLYVGLFVLLAFLGAMAMGLVGVILAFWVLLLWFSVWQTPYRFELLLLASLGLLGGVAMLPTSVWENVGWLGVFMLVAALPIVSLLTPWFSAKSER